MSDAPNDTTSQRIPEYRAHPWVPTEIRQTVDLEVLGTPVQVTYSGINDHGSAYYVVFARSHGSWETNHVTIDRQMRERTALILRKRILEAVGDASVGLRVRVPA